MAMDKNKILEELGKLNVRTQELETLRVGLLQDERDLGVHVAAHFSAHMDSTFSKHLPAKIIVERTLHEHGKYSLAVGLEFTQGYSLRNPSQYRELQAIVDEAKEFCNLYRQEHNTMIAFVETDFPKMRPR